ncbi:MAG: hypothetical protein ACRC6U_07970 [Fusobacteriaceae bacterium]
MAIVATRDYEFMIDGFPYIFTKKLDFKQLFLDWGYQPPKKITKQIKFEILVLTRDKFKDDQQSLNYKYWDFLCKEFPGQQLMKLF